MLSLPEELLQMCLYYLRPGLNTKDWEPTHCGDRLGHATLAAACRASKTCQRIALPLLYHTVEVCPTGKPCKTISDPPARGPNLTALLRTCLHNSKLALAIRELKVGVWSDAAQNHRATDLYWYESTLSQLHVSPSCLEKIRKGLAAGSPDAELAVLLFLCRNVRNLEFTATDRIAFALVTETCMEMARNTSYGLLPKLRTLTIRGEACARNGFELWEVAPFVNSVGLEVLRLFNLRCTSGLDHGPNGRPNSNTIATLDMYGACFMGNGFAQLMSCLPNLTGLKITIMGADIVNDGGTRDLRVVVQEMAQVLRIQGTKLETFSLAVTSTNSDAWAQATGLPGPFTPLGDLRPLMHLRQLTVCWSTLPWHDIFNKGYHCGEPSLMLTASLPPGLEELRIARPVQSAVPAAEGPVEGRRGIIENWRVLHDGVFVLCCDRRFEKLRRIEIEESMPFPRMIDGWVVEGGDGSVAIVKVGC